MTERQKSCRACRKELGPKEPATCSTCAGQATADLNAIRNAFGELRDDDGFSAPGGLTDRVTRSSEPALPGGMWLVMTTRQSAALGPDDDPGAPSSVQWVLWAWEADWQKQRRETPATVPALNRSVNYLLGNVPWAAQEYGQMRYFLDDLARTRRMLERITGTNDDPIEAPVPCLYCRGKLLRKYLPPGGKRRGGLEEDWTCEKCHKRYNRAQYWLMVKAHLERQAAEQFESEAS